ncbi:MAG TPA: transcriptional repressor LexA [Ktedonobacterales bacterium]|nr:transcriptional repressor LexA [Ktedonobacterales bacterium]
MRREMSDIQSKILDFIERYIHKEGRPPTNREIGAEVQILSTGHVDYHLTVLEKKGYIVRERKKSRGIRLAQQGLTIQGTIAAGLPLDIFPDEQQEMLDLGAHTREFVLLVRGNSMIDDQINDGDYVLVLPAETANNGEIIVATCMTSNGGNGAATLKRFYKEDTGVRLQPANSEMEPLHISKNDWDADWKIQGRVTGVFRRY